MGTPLFSIVTPSFNQGDFIKDTLESVINQPNYASVDYQIRDNQSTDSTANVITKYTSKIRYISECDEGQADAINRGWRSSAGRWLAWLNADDLYEPSALLTVADAIVANPRVRWIIGAFRIIDAQGRQVGRLHSTYKNFLLKHYSYRLLLTENIVPQMSVFIRRDLWEEVGDLTTTDHLAFDYEYWLRLAKISEPLIIRQCLSCFRYYRGTKTNENLRLQFSRELSYAKRLAPNYPWCHRIHALNYWKTILLYDLIKRF